jgi:glutamyl-tRNA synthetase
MLKKVWKDDTPQIILEVGRLFGESNDFTSPTLELMIKQYTESKNLGFGRVAAPLRLLLVGSGMGPHLFDILEMIGKEATVNRIDAGIRKITAT